MEYKHKFDPRLLYKHKGPIPLTCTFFLFKYLNALYMLRIEERLALHALFRCVHQNSEELAQLNRIHFKKITNYIPYPIYSDPTYSVPVSTSDILLSK